MGKTKGHILYLLLALAAIAGAELLLRVYYPPVQIVKVTFKGDRMMEGGSFKLSDDPVLLYEWKDMPQPFDAHKPDNTYRAVVLGDSVVLTQAFPRNDYFPGVLEGLLNKIPGKVRYEVLNAGVPGYNTRQEVRYLEAKLLPFAPDMVIVGYCSGNDRTIRRKVLKYRDGLYCSDISESYPYLLLLPSPVGRSLMKHSMLYRAVNGALIKAIGRSNKGLLDGRVAYFDDSLETEDAVKRIKDIAAKEKFELLFVIFPSLRDGEQKECEWIIGKCRQYGIPYIDLRDTFEKAGYEKVRISDADECHPNQAGNRLIAEEIFRYFTGHGIKR